MILWLIKKIEDHVKNQPDQIAPEFISQYEDAVKDAYRGKVRLRK